MNQEPEQEHQILSAKVIQRFIYDYILERLKTEKLTMQVDPFYVHFIKSLKCPFENFPDVLNDMRTMKEPNAASFRTLLRERSGGRVLNIIRDN